MRYACRLFPGLAILIAAAGLMTAQEPGPTPPPLPEAASTPVPSEAPATAAPALTPTQVIAPDLVVAPARDMPKIPSAGRKSAAARPDRVTTLSKTDDSGQTAGAVAGTAAAEASSGPPPPEAGAGPSGADSASLPAPPKAPADHPVQAEMDSERATRSTSADVSGWILIGAGVMLMIGVIVFALRQGPGQRLPTMFDQAIPSRPRSPLVGGRRL